MSIWGYLVDHWVAGTIAVVGGVFVWVATNALGKPLSEFWADRQRALRAIEEYWRVTDNSSEKRTEEALDALRKASASLATHASANGLAVRIYCKMRGYDLGRASQLIRGISQSIVEGYAADTVRVNTVDAARLMLGATGGMSAVRQIELRRMIAATSDT